MSAPSHGCPVEFTLSILGGKWRTVILAELKTGPKRYRDFRAKYVRLSEKVLSQRLRELREGGLIKAEEVHGASHYVLTAAGASLSPVLQALYDWGVERWTEEPA